MIKYVDIDDVNFKKFINKKFAEYKIPEHKKTLQEYCFPKKYEFQIPQKFLGEFINPDSPYHGILVYHGIGAGKTCASIKIAENFKDKKKILVVLPASLKGNYRTELRSLCGGTNYLSTKERTLLETLDPASLEYKEIIKKSDLRIDKYYTIYSYNKFFKLCQNNEISIKNTLLIIDEVHNVISETGSYYKLLSELIDKPPKDFKIVIMSATPIFDKPPEIALTMNLLIRDEEKKLPVGKDFINEFMDIKKITVDDKIKLEYTVKNMDIFKNKIKGLISYYRGAPPHVYPGWKLNLVKVKMSDFQKKIYSKVADCEKKINYEEDFVNKEVSNSFFIITRMISNVCYPNKKMGQEGYDSLSESDFSIENMKIYMPKFVKIMRRIKKCEGPVFVYSNFKGFGGIEIFIRMLEHFNYQNYQDEGAGLKRYAIWTSDTEQMFRDVLKSVFNKKNNKDGSQIKIMIGSSAIKEGVSLLRIREVHLIEPYWNWSRMNQIIGRAIRFCSHKDVPLEERHVDIYIYLATHPDIKESVDQRIMSMAFTKLEISDTFTTNMIEAAIDCDLFKNANDFENKYTCDA